MNHKFNSWAEMPEAYQCKYDIISNFIEHWTSDEKERVQMFLCLGEYINEDHVNEITERDVERNEEGDEFVASCNKCGNDVNDIDDNGLCSHCR